MLPIDLHELLAREPESRWATGLKEWLGELAAAETEQAVLHGGELARGRALLAREMAAEVTGAEKSFKDRVRALNPDRAFS